MFIIVGLGNPGKEYEGTRHNAGFDVIDRLADQYHISVEERKHRAFCGKGVIGGQKVVLVKPQTYMNLSGESVRSIVDYYKIDEESELLVIFDDISLDVGQIRIRKKGSAEGIMGLKILLLSLEQRSFSELKSELVRSQNTMIWQIMCLDIFPKENGKLWKRGYERAVKAAELIVAGAIEEAMNEYNKKVVVKES